MTVQFTKDLRNKVVFHKQKGKTKEETYNTLVAEGIFGNWLELTIDVIWDKLNGATYQTLSQTYGANYNLLIWLKNFESVVEGHKDAGETKAETYTAIQASQEFDDWISHAVYIAFDSLDGKSPRVLSEEYSMYRNIHPYVIILLTGSYNLGTPTTIIHDETQVNDYDAKWQGRPAIDFLDNGDIFVIWHSILRDGSRRGIVGQVLDVKFNRITEHFDVNSYIKGNQRWPSVACHAKCLTSWDSDGYDSHSDAIAAQLIDENYNRANDDDDILVNTYIKHAQRYSTTATWQTGWITVWGSWGQDTSKWGLYFQRFDSNADKIGSEIPVNTYTTASQINADADTFPNGNIVIVWQSTGQDLSSLGVFYNIFLPDGTKLYTQEPQVNTESQGAQHAPAVAIRTDGSFIVVFRDSSNGEDKIFYQLFDSSYNKVGTQETITTHSFHNIRNDPSVSVVKDKYFIVWAAEIEQGDDTKVLGKLLDENGGTIVDEFKINYHEASNIPNPNTACYENSCFTVYRGLDHLKENYHDIYISKSEFQDLIGGIE